MIETICFVFARSEELIRCADRCQAMFPTEIFLAGAERDRKTKFIYDGKSIGIVVDDSF